MGCLEFLVYFYLINTARGVKFSDLNFDPLIPYPSYSMLTREWLCGQYFFKIYQDVVPGEQCLALLYLFKELQTRWFLGAKSHTNLSHQ